MNVEKFDKITAIVMIVLFFAIIIFLFGYKTGTENVYSKMNETDGINSQGFICYAKQGNTIQRQIYIIIHELCHDIVKEEKEDFCT